VIANAFFCFVLIKKKNTNVWESRGKYESV